MYSDKRVPKAERRERGVPSDERMRTEINKTETKKIHNISEPNGRFFEITRK